MDGLFKSLGPIGPFVKYGLTFLFAGLAIYLFAIGGTSIVKSIKGERLDKHSGGMALLQLLMGAVLAVGVAWVWMAGNTFKGLSGL